MGREGSIRDGADRVVHRRQGGGGHRVEGPPDLLVRAREVERHRRAAHAHRHRDLDPPVEIDAVVVEIVLEGVVTVRDGLHLPARQDLRAVQQLVDVVEHALRPVRREQLAQPDGPQPPRGDLRHEITAEHLGQPYVSLDQIEEVLVQLAAAEELGGRDDDALLVELGGIRRHAARRAPAHVLVMAHGARQRHRPPFGEHGQGERDVRQVGAAVVGIVEEEGVAVAHALGRERAHDALGRALERSQVDGNGRGLGDRLALDVEEGRRGVEALLDDRRRRALEQGQLHLVGDGLEAVAQHLQEHGVDGTMPAHHALLIRRLPEASTRATYPGGITLVESACSTMAGPASRDPRGSRARS